MKSQVRSSLNENDFPIGDELPEGWKLVTILDVCEVNPPKPPKDFLPADAPVTFVPMPAVDADQGAITNPVIRPYLEVRNGFTSFRDGDVIMAKITPCMENGKAAIIQGMKNGIGFGSTEFHVLRSKGLILPQYLYYFIRQVSFRKEAEEHFTGSVGQKRVPTDFIKTAVIPLPPLAEQHRIVARVEALLSQVNAARDRLNRVPLIMKRFRQAVLAAACSGRLTEGWREEHPEVTPAANAIELLLKMREELWRSREKEIIRKKMSLKGSYAIKGKQYKSPYNPKFFHKLPNTWQEVTISQLCLLDVGYSFKSKDFCNEGIRLLRGENIEPGTLRWQETKYWNPEKLVGYENLLVEEGDIILGMDRPIISGGLKIATVKKEDLPALLVQRVMRFKMINPYCRQLIYYNLLKKEFIDYLKQGLTGSDLPHITGTNIAEYCIGFPPIPEQYEIVCRVDTLFALADQIEQQVADASKRTEALTQAVLAKAFRGELVATDEIIVNEN